MSDTVADESQDEAAVVAGAPGRPADHIRVPWELLIAKTWRDVALCAYACVALAVLIWEFSNLRLLVAYAMNVEDPMSGVEQAEARTRLGI